MQRRCHTYFAIVIVLILTFVQNAEQSCSDSVQLYYKDRVCPCTIKQSSNDGVCGACNIPNCKLCSADNSSQCDHCHKNYAVNPKTFLCEEQCSKLTRRTEICPPNYSIDKQTGKCQECQVAYCLLCSQDDPYQCDIYPHSTSEMAIGIWAVIFLGIPFIGLTIYGISSRFQKKSRYEMSEQIQSN